MDIQAYISSGILEAYALGALTDEERAQVEAEVARYTELAEELRVIEDSMVQFAVQDAQQPPAHLKDQIWNAIQQNEAAPKQEAQKITIAETRNDTVEQRTIPLGQTPSAPKFNLQRAAIWALLIGSVVMNVVLFNRTNEIKESERVASAKIDSMATEQAKLAQITENYRKQATMMADSTMQTIVMKGKENGATMAATVYANVQTGSVYLAMQNMPLPPKGMQYQLWIIKDGKPVSMGVIPTEMIASQDMQKIPMEIKGGVAYAISLEKEGGVEVPTAVKVVGKVS